MANTTVSIDENGKIKVIVREEDGNILDVILGAVVMVNVSTEDGEGIANREVTSTIGYFDFTGTTDENGDVVWSSVAINVETQNVDIKVTNGQIETTGFLFNSAFNKEDYAGYSGVSITGNPAKKGENATVSYKPNDGYTLKSVTIDGVDKTAENANGVTFENIDADHSVEVVYEKTDGVDTNDGVGSTDNPSASSDLPSTGDSTTVLGALMASLAGIFGGAALTSKNNRAKLRNRKH